MPTSRFERQIGRRTFCLGLGASALVSSVPNRPAVAAGLAGNGVAVSYGEGLRGTGAGEHFMVRESGNAMRLYLRTGNSAELLGRVVSVEPSRWDTELKDAELLPLMPAWGWLGAITGGATYRLWTGVSSAGLKKLDKLDKANVLAAGLVHASQPTFMLRQFDGPAKASWFGVLSNTAQSQSFSWKTLSDLAPFVSEGVQLDPGSYAYDGSMRLDGAKLEGHPDGSEIVATNPHRSWIRISGEQSALRNLRLRVLDTDRRLQNTESSVVACFKAMGFRLENLSIIGGASAGIYIRESEGGTLRNCHVAKTKADGFHITHASHHITVSDCSATDTGDDGFAVVSYAERGFGVCSDIDFERVTSTRSAARGIAVVGGERIVVRDVDVIESSAAGCYLFSESSYNTYGVSDCRVEGARIVRAVLDDRIGNAAVQIGGRRGSRTTPDGRTISNAAINCHVQDVSVEGSGPGMRAAFAFDPYCVDGSAARLRISNALGRPAKPADAIQLNGQNASVRNMRAENIGGYLVNVGRTAGGNHTISDISASGLKRHQKLTPGYVLVQPAIRLETLILDSVDITSQDPLPARFVDRSRAVGVQSVRLLDASANGRRYTQ